MPVATPLTHCPECGVNFQGRYPRDPRKHYTAHYPPYDQLPRGGEHYVLRKRAAMLLSNDAHAEPPEGAPVLALTAPPRPDPAEEED